MSGSHRGLWCLLIDPTVPNGPRVLRKYGASMSPYGVLQVALLVGWIYPRMDLWGV